MFWYYAKDGNQQGPVEEEELKSLARDGYLSPDDLVWNDKMGDDWARAGDVPGIFAPEGDVPPPLPPAAASGRVSCVAPVGQAWRRMIEILFRPFNMKKWFGIGVTAWLAGLAQGGGGSSSYSSSGSDSGEWPEDLDTAEFKEFFGEILEQCRSFLEQYGHLVTWGIVVGVLLSVGMGLLLLWLSCRGKFMFIDNVVNDRAEVNAPWRTFAQHAGSLFKWNIGYYVVCFVLFLPILAIAVVGGIVPCIKAGKLLPSVVGSMSIAGALTVIYGIVVGYVSRFREDFIIPIMYNMDLTTTEAWRKFMPVLKGHFWSLMLYGLFYAVLSAAAASAIMALVLVTCCVAGCLMAFPVLNTVVILPIPVFFRLYSIRYLSQFGPEYEPVPDGVMQVGAPSQP